MTNKNIIIGVVVVLILAAGAWYWMSTSSTTSGTPSTTASSTATNTATNQGTTIAGTGTLRTLVTQGGNYTCTVNTVAATGGGQTMGTIYSAGGKTRLDFQITNGGQTFTTHTIRSGSTAYTWVDGQTKGTKTAITASSAIIPQPTGGVIAVNDNAQVSSECHPWSPLASEFVVPAGITF